jgi:hypothetical protein
VFSLVGNLLDHFTDLLGFIFIPLGFFIVSGSALLANRIALRSKTQTPFRFRQSIVIGAKKKKKERGPVIEKKSLGRLQSVKPKVEFGFHTCPVHGIEKCAGNYLDLHSCNSTNQTSSKQIFWKEVTTAMPAK